MLVSHEVPRALMQVSRSFNDYDYALVHKFKDDPEYYEFFKESLRQGRTVYLDNSLFELEEMFDHEEFAKYVRELGSINPGNFYYIVPDALEEAKITMESFLEFTQKYHDLPGNSIGVVQGKTLEEIEDCYDFMDIYADVIAISFDYSWYESVFPAEMNVYHSWMKGRQFLINHLMQGGLSSKKHHLLGCGLPQEFQHYKDIPEIFSCDTSNPIVMGMKGWKYGEFGTESAGLGTKESIKLVDLFEAKLELEDLVTIQHNITEFRKLAKKDYNG